MAATIYYTSQELRRMSPAELEAAARSLIRGARRTPSPEELQELEAQLQAFELARGCSTEEMRAWVREGSMREDETVCSWLMAADLLERLRAMVQNP